MICILQIEFKVVVLVVQGRAKACYRAQATDKTSEMVSEWSDSGRFLTGCRSTSASTTCETACRSPKVDCLMNDHRGDNLGLWKLSDHHWSPKKTTLPSCPPQAGYKETSCTDSTSPIPGWPDTSWKTLSHESTRCVAGLKRQLSLDDFQMFFPTGYVFLPCWTPWAFLSTRILVDLIVAEAWSEHSPMHQTLQLDLPRPPKPCWTRVPQGMTMCRIQGRQYQLQILYVHHPVVHAMDE